MRCAQFTSGVNLVEVYATVDRRARASRSTGLDRGRLRGRRGRRAAADRGVRGGRVSAGGRARHRPQLQHGGQPRWPSREVGRARVRRRAPGRRSGDGHRDRQRRGGRSRRCRPIASAALAAVDRLERVGHDAAERRRGRPRSTPSSRRAAGGRSCCCRTGRIAYSRYERRPRSSSARGGATCSSTRSRIGRREPPLFAELAAVTGGRSFARSRTGAS